jgi:DNA polymerase-3 subunit delta'
MMNLPWLQDNADQWLQLLLADKLPHAILLSGAKGLGKCEIAKHMAHLALCENLTDKGACETCRACHMYKAKNHLDLTVISAEKAVIKVDQIRQLTRKITLSTTRNQHKVIVIENAEQMNKAAANALLKTLEEPPVNVVIILTTSEMGRLLATIKSRCIKITIPTPKFNMALQWLISLVQYSEEECSLALTLTSGSPITAKNMMQEETLQKVKEMLSDLNRLSQNKVALLDVSKNWYSQNLDLNFSYIAAYFLTKLKVNNSMQLHENMPNVIEVLSNNPVKTNQKLLKFVGRLFQYIKYSQTPLKKELLIEELLIHWQRDFNYAHQ